MRRERFLHSLHTVLPQFHLKQNDIVEWILSAHKQSEVLNGHEVGEDFEKGLRRYLLKDKHIKERYFECGELHENWEDQEIYHLTQNNPSGSDIHTRGLFYVQKAKGVFEAFYGEAVPEHLIHVTCTGYLSPSPPQVYFSQKKSHPDITHAYHMGCYASIPATRLALGISRSENKKVDVVHTEMCSLHLDPSNHSPEQMVVQSLFADGHVKYTVSDSCDYGYKIHSIHEALTPDSLDDMTWVPGPFGMQMKLSREVPFKIRDSIPAFFTDLCKKAQLSPNDVLQNAVFAIHPGGPKIIEMVQKKLELKDQQVQHSRKVLFERGNMSSATLPHVWKEILQDEVPAGKLIVSLAFGPGLTTFGAIFEVVRK